MRKTLNIIYNGSPDRLKEGHQCRRYKRTITIARRENAGKTLAKLRSPEVAKLVGVSIDDRVARTTYARKSES